MKQCAKCGHQNDDANMFCESCGNILSGEGANPSSSSSYTEQPRPELKERKQLNKKKIIVVAVVIIFIAAVGAIIFFSFQNDPTNFDDDGQIHTNGVKMWDIGNDSKLRYSKSGDVGGHYKIIVTDSQESKVGFRYQDKTTTSSSDSTEYGDGSWTRKYLKSLYSGILVEEDGHKYYIHEEANRTFYVDVESGVPYYIIEDGCTWTLKYCDLKPM